MSDLVEKVEWLRMHDDTARYIGENGQALALSLSYEAELKTAGRTIAAAARYFGGQSETELQFGLDIPAEARLLDGWAAPREDGLPTLGHESRLELPRPIAAESFVLTLDVSPCVDPPAPPAQRVVVVVNGEILREAVLFNAPIAALSGAVAHHGDSGSAYCHVTAPGRYEPRI